MKTYYGISFSKQLITYLLIVLVFAFVIISSTIVSSVDQFVGKNALSQIEQYTQAVRNDFKQEIKKIEDIPEQIILTYHSQPPHHFSDLPRICMQSHNKMLSCSMFYKPLSSFDSSNTTQIIAQREPNGNITQTCEKAWAICETDTNNQFLHRLPKEGFWIYSQLNDKKIITLYYPINNRLIGCSGYLRMDFPLNIFIEKIKSFPLYINGKLFLVDQLNNHIIWGQEPNFFVSQEDIKHSELMQTSSNKESKSFLFNKGKQEHILFHTPLNIFSWSFCIVSSYESIIKPSYTLYNILFLCLGGGLLFLLTSMISIVIYQSAPLRKLTYMTRQIADGQFNAELPPIRSNNEIAKLYESFRYMQICLINYIDKLKISMKEKEQRNLEMNMARRIQQRFLPHHIELPSHIHIAAELRQSMEVGGDLYDFFILSNRLYFVIGDVAGKGVPAALHMVSVAKLFRYIAKNHTSTATICNIINNHMCEDSEDDMYITMFMGILDIHTGIMTYTNAGHPYPLLIPENGKTHYMNKYPDIPIGILEDHIFSEHNYIMPNNSSILLYTDGITDAENPEGQFYGKERLLECIDTVYAKEPEQIINTVLEDINKHISARGQSDDLTLLYLHYWHPAMYHHNLVEISCK